MTLELSEGTIYGARYWTVYPVPSWHLGGNWGNIDSWHQMVEWCVETFGATTGDGVFTPGQRWYVNNAKFWFRNESDRDWFLLKWQ